MRQIIINKNDAGQRIDKFLTDGYRNITQAFEIEQKEAKEKMKNLVDYIDVSE